ncbi:hypothetical protein NP493_2796g00000 [Ridgeia piscesae]|uniref:DNA topoisomerase n=1 Tax=Ridgeia piscesae TaxID=27915 RepID=A0AAD9JC55_RIDPI|nr:hypothetical protein NP493_2796g00000 [Ridgeia piscesae]
MGLVEGYDAMGFEMSKPHLRAELEADLKRICDGTKDKNVVLQAQVVKYRDVFVEVVQQATKIDTALAEYFGNAHQVNHEVVETLASSVVRPCPNCGNDMLLKTKKDGRGWFLSCMGYPECRAAIWFPDFVLHVSVDDAVCDIVSVLSNNKIQSEPFDRNSCLPKLFSLGFDVLT